jgi:hypothetical protein
MIRAPDAVRNPPYLYHLLAGQIRTVLRRSGPSAVLFFFIIAGAIAGWSLSGRGR